MYPTSCDTSYAKSERVCPCGERLARWLTAEYVVSTLSKEGKWDKVPASLSGPSLRPRCVPLSRLGGAPHPRNEGRWSDQSLDSSKASGQRAFSPSCCLGSRGS